MIVDINKQTAVKNKQKGEKMQQRYCECGFPVWVQYHLSESECRMIFWATAYRCGTKLRTCPCCSRMLHIDDLN